MPPKIIPSATSKPATVTFLLWTILRKKSKLNPNPSTIFFINHDKNKEDTWEMEIRAYWIFPTLDYLQKKVYIKCKPLNELVGQKFLPHFI